MLFVAFLIALTAFAVPSLHVLTVLCRGRQEMALPPRERGP